MTTSEYNTEFYPKYSAAICMLDSIENTLHKLKDQEDVRYQFSCSGWNKDSIKFLEDAVVYYGKSMAEQAVKETVGAVLIYGSCGDVTPIKKSDCIKEIEII